jgi:nucleotide-binding universal stress UspA family protein
VRILVALERGESTRETARLLGALFSPAATRVRPLHVGRVLIPLFYVPGFERLDSLRREQLAWEQEKLRALDRQIIPILDAGFGMELEVTSGSPLAEIRKRAQLRHADLILARPRQGAAGPGGLGNVATGLMQTAPAPVHEAGRSEKRTWRKRRDKRWPTARRNVPSS